MVSKQQTLRVTGLPLSSQIEDVKQFFGDRIKNKGRQIVESVGPFSQDAFSPHKQTTVSFSSHDAATQALGLDYASRRFMARGGGMEYISLDDTFEDITTLHTCANPETGHPDIDIVALHGLNGHAWNTFTTSEIVEPTAHRIREFNWLRDKLPMLLEHKKIYPRVMSFGYNADVWMTKSVADISIPVNRLLYFLDVERHQDPQRPLFFIGHSLGGIVIKEAIVALANDAMMQTIDPKSPTQGRYAFPVKGCMFFGVPHQGASIADKALRFLNVLSLVFNINKNNIQDLKSKSQRFANISSEFRTVQTEQDFQVLSFFETVKYKHHGMIVERDSATYDHPGCPKPFGVNRNHKDIAKYSTGDEHALKPAVNFLARVALDAIALRKLRSHPTIAPPPPPAPVDDEGHAVEDTFSTLADYDTVFLIDDSPSMQGQKWELVQTILEYSTVVATRYDTDGIDIHFMNNVNANQDNVKDPQVAVNIHRDIELKGSTPTRDRLSRHLGGYLQRFRANQSNDTFKYYNLIVLTDGEPNPEYEDPMEISDQEDAKKYKAAFRLIRKGIFEIAKKLDELEAEPGQVGIQFCQIGNDRDATAFFGFVDNQLKGRHRLGRDMVDIIKCQTERDLTHAFFEKLLLGAIEKRSAHAELEMAEKMNRRALKVKERVLGVEHADTLTSVRNLALVLRYQGKYKEAEELYRRALEGREKLLGVEHPLTLSSTNDLALMLKYQGEYETPKEIDRQAVQRTTPPSSSRFKASDQSDSSETASIAFSTWSEFSTSSASSYASTSDILVAALDEVIAVFMSDEELRCLFAEAFNKQNRDRVSRKGARLLKWLGRRLVMAAHTQAEKETAKFFLRRKHDQAIIDKIAQREEVRQQEASKQERLELYLQQQMVKPITNLESEETPAFTTETIDDHWTSFGRSDASSDSEDEDRDKQQIDSLNIDAVKQFLKSSDAFARFKEELEDFIDPFRSEAMWTKPLWNSGEQVRFELSSNVPRLTNIDKLKISTEEKLGMSILWWPLKQPRKHLSSSKVRIIWICECGDETYADVSCAKARRYRQMCDTSPAKVIASQPPILPTNNGTLADSSDGRGLKKWTSALMEKFTSLQQRRTRKEGSSPASQGSEQNATIVSNATLTTKYIHWCVDSAPRRTFLHHICIEKKKGKDFVDELCKSYKKLRGWRWYFSMTTCTEIKLVRLSRVYDEAVICTFKGDVLPDLNNQNEYTYNIIPPDLEKEIHILRAERALIDYYHGYKNCRVTDHISQLILGIPHRVTGTELGLKGYGIWARQGWTLSRLATFALITQGWAVVFIACWLWYHPGDLQNAFSPAYYSLGLVTIFVAIPDVFLT